MRHTVVISYRLSRNCRRLGAAGALILCGLVAPLLGQQASQEEFFEARICRLLVENCFIFHTELETSGLRIDSRERLSTLLTLQAGPRQSPVSHCAGAEPLLTRGLLNESRRVQ